MRMTKAYSQSRYEIRLWDRVNSEEYQDIARLSPELANVTISLGIPSEHEVVLTVRDKMQGNVGFRCKMQMSKLCKKSHQILRENIA